MKIGIIGAGQLARMIALSGYPLGAEFVFLDPSADACSSPVGHLIQSDYDNFDALAQLAGCVDVVTYEFENVPAKVAAFLAERTRVYPPPLALAKAQDRLVEKNFFNELGIPTPAYCAIDNIDDLRTAIVDIGYPAILKGRTQGYDGKGQYMIRSPQDLQSAIDAMAGKSAILEGFVPFCREVSIIAVRACDGDIKFYPLSENYHRGGILRVAQCKAHDPMTSQAHDYVTRLLTALDYVGTIALELFDVKGQLIANEFAPRVHNSGHWTIEGAQTSQFENHCRAIMQLPLGDTSAVGMSAMVNFIGGLASKENVLSISGAHMHWYGKEPRKGRKVGHATIRRQEEDDFCNSLRILSHLADTVDDS